MTKHLSELSMQSIHCHLPEYLTEKNLFEKIHFSETKKDKKLELLIEDNHFCFMDNVEPSCLIYFDWSKVIFFDDSALLQLLLLQHKLLINNIELTHYDPEYNNSKQKRSFPASSKIICRLFEMGYFKIWSFTDYNASINEVSLLASIIPDAKTKIHQAGLLLPILACNSYKRILRGSPEDLTIQKFERKMEYEVFKNKNNDSTRNCELAITSKFSQLIVRQCRNNVLEHAKPLDYALSSARIITRSDFETLWEIKYDEIDAENKSLLIKLIEKFPPDTPVLDFITIDDGRGICGENGTLTKIFSNLEKKDPKTYHRVMSQIPFDWHDDFKILNFCLDERGSSKTTEMRSLEHPGLHKIGKLVLEKKYNGAIEITSGNRRMTFLANSERISSISKRPWERGTQIRIVVPLIREEFSKELF